MPDDDKPNSFEMLDALEALGYSILPIHTSKGLQFIAWNDQDESRFKGFGRDLEEAVANLWQSYLNHHDDAYRLQELKMAEMKRRGRDREPGED